MLLDATASNSFMEAANIQKVAIRAVQVYAKICIYIYMYAKHIFFSSVNLEFVQFSFFCYLSLE